MAAPVLPAVAGHDWPPCLGPRWPAGAAAGRQRFEGPQRALLVVRGPRGGCTAVARRLHGGCAGIAPGHPVLSCSQGVPWPGGGAGRGCCRGPAARPRAPLEDSTMPFWCRMLVVIRALLSGARGPLCFPTSAGPPLKSSVCLIKQNVLSFVQKRRYVRRHLCGVAPTYWRALVVGTRGSHPPHHCLGGPAAAKVHGSGRRSAPTRCQDGAG